MPAVREFQEDLAPFRGTQEGDLIALAVMEDLAALEVVVAALAVIALMVAATLATQVVVAIFR